MKFFPKLDAKNIPYPLIFVFLILSLAIWTAGYHYYNEQKEDIRKDEQEDLLAIADLKVKQIEDWRRERLGDAIVIFNNPFIIRQIHQYMQNDSQGIRQEILSTMDTLLKQYQYKSVILLDAQGHIKLAVPVGQEILGPDAKRLAAEAFNTKKVVFSDLYSSKITNAIRLTVVVPLLALKGQNTAPIGVLLLRIDPFQFLYPLIQTWPTPSRTAETSLVRREEDEVVYLNELRHKRDTALTLRFPISSKALPAAMASQGFEGVFEGIDYRGVPVLAAIKRIPDSPWFLIAKVDKEEIYAPVRERFRIMVILVSVLIIASGFGIGFLWRHQQAGYYRREHESDVKRLALLQHFEYLTKYANDIILLIGGEGRIVEANDRATLSYGYTSDELLQLDMKKLRAIETRSALDEQLRQVEEHNGLVFETMHQRKDGSTFPVEVSSRVIEIEGKKFYQNIIRDISERKEAEEELKKYREHLEDIVKERTNDLTLANKQLQQEILIRKRAEEEIINLNRELEQSVIELSTVNKEMEAFSYSVSHDLRAPLRSIDGFSQAILEEYSYKLDETGKDYLQRVRGASQRMAQLIDEMLNLSRVTRSEMRREEVDLSTLAGEISGEVKKTMPGRQVELVIQEGLTVNGDARLLRILLDNLIRNAFKFTAKNDRAKIEFGLTQHDGNPVYFVRDNGVGFDMIYVNKLFGAFQRLHSQTEFPVPESDLRLSSGLSTVTEAASGQREQWERGQRSISLYQNRESRRRLAICKEGGYNDKRKNYSFGGRQSGRC